MGILANSASVTMTTSTSDDVSSGYVTGEQIALSTNPSGTTYLWGWSIPSGSAAGRSALQSPTDPNPTFVPDQAGTYLLTCTVDTTTVYVLRVTVAAVSVSESAQVLRLSPVGDATVPPPAAGVCLYFSSTQNALVTKAPDGTVTVL